MKKPAGGEPAVRLKAKLKVSSKPPPGVQRGGEDPEAHFLLRVPENMVDSLHEALDKKDLSDVNFTFADNGRDATFCLKGQALRARLVDLPTILETHKTFDNKQLYKIADISQMLIVDDAPPLPQAPVAPTSTRIGKGHDDEQYKYPHGIAPPFKNVRTRRFRKRAKWMIEDVEREVKRLLEVDDRCDETRISFINREDDVEGEDNVQVDDGDDDLSDHLSIGSVEGVNDRDLGEDEEGPGDLGGDEEAEDEEDEEGRDRSAVPSSTLGDEEEDENVEDEEEEEEGEEAEGDEGEEAEQEEEEGSDDSEDEGESAQQRQQMLTAERQAIIVQQMEVSRAVEEKKKQLSTTPNPIMRGRIQTALTELEARSETLRDQLANVNERLQAFMRT